MNIACLGQPAISLVILCEAGSFQCLDLLELYYSYTNIVEDSVSYLLHGTHIIITYAHIATCRCYDNPCNVVMEITTELISISKYGGG